MPEAPEFSDIVAADPDAAGSRRQRGGRIAAVAAVVVAVTVLAIALALSRGPAGQSPAGAGTSPAGAPSTSPPVDLAAVTADISCDWPKESDRVALDDLDKFPAVAMFTCAGDDRTYEDGEWSVNIREATTSGVAAVIAAMHGPAPDTGGSCDLVLIADPAVAFVAADGSSVVPKYRHDECGHPIGLAAFRGINWEQLAVVKDTLQQSSEEIAAGCSHQYKNMNYYEGQGDHQVSAGGPVFPDDGNTLHACVYRTNGEIDVGTFVTDVSFTADQSDKLRTALSQPGSNADCKPQQNFALVFDGERQVDVELGGCHRVLRNGGVGAADGSVLQDLFGQS